MTDRLDDLYPAHLQTVMQRHDRAMASAGYDHVIVFSGPIRYAFLDDSPQPFVANPHFKGWVPLIDNPYCSIVYTPGRKPRLNFFQPVDYWYKPADTPSAPWVSYFDLRIIARPEEAKKHYPNSGRIAFIGEPDGGHPGDLNPAPLLNPLHFDRAWKTAYEIECIRRANRIGAIGHRAAERAFRAGASEYEIHLEYLRSSHTTEEDLPYRNIIAMNENAAVLHYLQHDRERLAESDRHSFLIDAGASVNGYAADITRTYSQRPGEYEEMIDALHAAQQEICAAVRPKIHYPELQTLTHRKIAEILERFEFVRGIDADGIVTRRISTAFFPHGVGHYLGLQVHDVGGFMADAAGHSIPKPEGDPYLRLTRVVEPDHVFTIEPGFYFIEPLLAELKNGDDAKFINWPRVDQFRKFGGIRIEDDVAVTPDGHENLTRAAFAEM